MVLSDSKLRSIKAPYVGTLEIPDRDGLTARIKTQLLFLIFVFNGLVKPNVCRLGAIQRLD
jgi:hypothetical protein